jgi:hypothetical protein
MSRMDVDVLGNGWRKASHSVANGQCVEVAAASARVLVRDSVNRTGAVIALAPAAWQAFIGSAKAGTLEFH